MGKNFLLSIPTSALTWNETLIENFITDESVLLKLFVK